MTCIQRLSAYDTLVSRHLHDAIVRDLSDLLSEPSVSAHSPISLPSAHSSVSFSRGDGSFDPINIEGTEASSVSLIAQLPKSKPEMPIHLRKICQVQFKHAYRNYRLPEALSNIGIGEFVIVQSFVDKSQEDLGIVVAVHSPEEFERLMKAEGPFLDADENKVGKVLRVALPEERSFLPVKAQRESPLLRICQTFIDRILLPMTVYGVEYQFDGNLLYVYYVSQDRVDFRPLVTFLSRKYCRGTRIQMKKTNHCREFMPLSFAAEALASGVHSAPPVHYFGGAV